CGVALFLDGVAPCTLPAVLDQRCERCFSPQPLIPRQELPLIASAAAQVPIGRRGLRCSLSATRQKGCSSSMSPRCRCAFAGVAAFGFGFFSSPASRVSGTHQDRRRGRALIFRLALEQLDLLADPIVALWPPRFEQRLDIGDVEAKAQTVAEDQHRLVETSDLDPTISPRI